MSPRLPDRRRVRRAIPTPLRHLLYDAGLSRRLRWRRVPGIERVRPGAVTITFDDGPDPDGTPAVLAALEELDARATFFVLGAHVEQSPDLVREIRERGHELALHGRDHYRHDGLDPDQAREELAAGLATIEAATGERPRWYRPPFGRSSRNLATACGELGMEIVYWSSWGFDWEPAPAEEIARVVLRDLEGGAIALLHDSARYAERERPAATAAALPAIVAEARRRGLEILPLGAALDGR